MRRKRLWIALGGVGLAGLAALLGWVVTLPYCIDSAGPTLLRNGQLHARLGHPLKCQLLSHTPGLHEMHRSSWRSTYLIVGPLGLASASVDGHESRGFVGGRWRVSFPLGAPLEFDDESGFATGGEEREKLR